MCSISISSAVAEDARHLVASSGWHLVECPRRPSGALLRGRARVLVGEVEEARAALEDLGPAEEETCWRATSGTAGSSALAHLDTAVIGQEWDLLGSGHVTASGLRRELWQAPDRTVAVAGA